MKILDCRQADKMGFNHIELNLDELEIIDRREYRHDFGVSVIYCVKLDGFYCPLVTGPSEVYGNLFQNDYDGMLITNYKNLSGFTRWYNRHYTTPNREKTPSPVGYSFKNANAVYTGGGIWLFYGELTSGEYFLTDDYGCTLILNESPADFDESLYVEWQQEHTIKELLDEERIAFCDKLADRLLRHNKADNLGGIDDYEIRRYKEYWRMPM